VQCYSTGSQLWSQSSVTSWSRVVSLPYHFQTGPGTHPAYYPIGTGASPLRAREWSWPSPLSSAGVKACQFLGSYFLAFRHRGPGSILGQICGIFGEQSGTVIMFSPATSDLASVICWHIPCSYAIMLYTTRGMNINVCIYPVNIILPILHIHDSLIYHQHYTILANDSIINL
jgi:hypothetical protein